MSKILFQKTVQELSFEKGTSKLYFEQFYGNISRILSCEHGNDHPIHLSDTSGAVIVKPALKMKHLGIKRLQNSEAASGCL